MHIKPTANILLTQHDLSEASLASFYKSRLLENVDKALSSIAEDCFKLSTLKTLSVLISLSSSYSSYTHHKLLAFIVELLRQRKHADMMDEATTKTLIAALKETACKKLQVEFAYALLSRQVFDLVPQTFYLDSMSMKSPSLSQVIIRMGMNSDLDFSLTPVQLKKIREVNLKHLKDFSTVFSKETGLDFNNSLYEASTFSSLQASCLYARTYLILLPYENLLEQISKGVESYKHSYSDRNMSNFINRAINLTLSTPYNLLSSGYCSEHIKPYLMKEIY